MKPMDDTHSPRVPMKDQEGGVLERYCEQVRLINGGFGNVFQMDYVEGM